jgi:hypothetical protein
LGWIDARDPQIPLLKGHVDDETSIIETARKVGHLDFADRVAAIREHYDTFFQKIEKREITTISDTKCALIVQSKTDRFGAMNPEKRRELVHMMDALERHQLTPVFQYVESVQEIARAVNLLRQNQNDLSVLVLRAHGKPDRCQISKTEYVRPSNEWKEIVEHLPPHATIVFHSCSTGRDFPGQDSIARITSTYQRGVTVFAPSRDMAHSLLQFDTEHRVSGVYMATPEEPHKHMGVSFRNGQPVECNERILPKSYPNL